MKFEILKSKIEGTWVRFFQALAFLPSRVLRLAVHLTKVRRGSRTGKVSPLPISRHGLWVLELTFYVMDVLAVPEIYETVMDWVKWNTRPLSGAEIEVARTVYGSSFDYRRVRVDERAQVVSRKTGIFYVSFFTINCWGGFDKKLLVHELMHVWQFHKFGSVYIPRALLAQRTIAGYDYGGHAFLESMKKENGSLLDFNFEQQGDIVADGFALRNGLCPRWTDASSGQIPVFEAYLSELQTTK